MYRNSGITKIGKYWEFLLSFNTLIVKGFTQGHLQQPPPFFLFNTPVYVNPL